MRVRLLEGESLATARHIENNLISSESIQLGEEVAVECAIEDLQAQFYVQWSGNLFLFNIAIELEILRGSRL